MLVSGYGQVLVMASISAGFARRRLNVPPTPERSGAMCTHAVRRSGLMSWRSRGSEMSKPKAVARRRTAVGCPPFVLTDGQRISLLEPGVDPVRLHFVGAPDRASNGRRHRLRPTQNSFGDSRP